MIVDWKIYSPILALILGNAAFIVPLFLWNRAESRADMRQMDLKMESFRADTRSIISAIQEDMKDFHVKLALQDKEFKMRLCAIEERYRK